MKKITLFFSLLAAVVSSAPVIADSLVIYSGRSDKFVKPVLQAFTKKTGIDVIIHAGKSTALLNKLDVEGQRTGADLFISNDAGTLQKGSDFGLFAPLPEELVSNINKRYRAKDNSWVGLSARARVLVVNNDSDAKSWVKSVFDLADPRLKGRLAITNSTNESYIAGATVYMMATSESKTKDWLAGMKNNVDSQVFNKHSKIVKAVASGKKDVGLVNHYYIYRHLAKKPNAPISIVVPDQGNDGMGVAWNVAGVAISKHTKKRALAEKLVSYLVSKSGQKQFAAVNREYPTREGINASAEVPPVDSFRVADVPMYELGKQRNATIDLIEQVGMP